VIGKTIVIYREDTRLIDFVGALAAGLMLQYQSWSSVSSLLVDPGIFTADNLRNGFLYMAAFALSALIVCSWKSRLRRLIGWIIIAALGAAFCTGINEYFVAKAFEAEPMVLFEGFGWVILSFVSKLWTALLVMGVVHYSAILLREAKNKIGARYQSAA
jgi:hypothetical protein